MAFVDGQCIQDQYGNRYTLAIDHERQFITGKFDCYDGGGPWILTGSYVQSSPSDPWIFELTVTNSNGVNEAGKVAVFKIKGVEPKAAWYYPDTINPQEFEFRKCSDETPIVGDNAPLKPGECRGLLRG